VTFPAFEGADIGIRSLTDHFVPAARMAVERELLLARLEIDEELRAAVMARADEWRRDGARSVIEKAAEVDGRRGTAAPERHSATTPLRGIHKQRVPGLLN
jgi:hypothetical protein